MGQLRYFIFNITRILPKKYRKPAYMITSILGMLIFLRFMTGITHSIYLISLQNALNGFIEETIVNGSFPIVLASMFLIFTWLGWKYYKSVQTVITFGYVIILVLSILPFILR